MKTTASGREKKTKTNLNQISSFTRFWHAVLFFYQAHLNKSAPKRFVRLVSRMQPACLFCCYLLMGFLFCITRANLIRAEGIQISVHPPNAIWSPNKGLEERKDRITNVFSRAGKRNCLRNVSLLTNECNFTNWPNWLK